MSRFASVVWLLVAVAAAQFALTSPESPPSPICAPLIYRLPKLLSLTGTVVPPEASDLAVVLSAGQGHVLGGCVVSPLVAAGTIKIFAATLANAVYECLPVHDAQNVDIKPDLDGAGSADAGATSD